MTTVRRKQAVLLACLLLVGGCDYAVGGKSDVELCVEAHMTSHAAEQTQSVAESLALKAALSVARTKLAIEKNAIRDGRVPKAEKAEEEASVKYGESIPIEEIYPEEQPKPVLPSKLTPSEKKKLKEREAREKEAMQLLERAESETNKSQAEAKAWKTCLRAAAGK